MRLTESGPLMDDRFSEKENVLQPQSMNFLAYKPSETIWKDSVLPGPISQLTSEFFHPMFM